MLVNLQIIRSILGHAIGKVIVFVIGVAVSAGNVLYILGLDVFGLGSLIEAAHKRQLLGDILFAFVPLLTLSVISVLSHLIVYRALVSEWFGWFLLVVTGYLLFKFFEMTVLWRDCTLGSLDMDRLSYAEGAIIRALVGLLIAEVLLAVHGAWVTRR